MASQRKICWVSSVVYLEPYIGFLVCSLPCTESKALHPCEEAALQSLLSRVVLSWEEREGEGRLDSWAQPGLSQGQREGACAMSCTSWLVAVT